MLECGSVHEWKDFSIGVITRLKRICDYNHGRIYFINGNGKISDQYIIGLDKKWVSAYHEYYSKILNGRYAIPTQLSENIPPHDKPVHMRDWSQAENDEFVVDYVRALGINYSLGFSLFDTDGNAKLVDFGLAGMQKNTDEIWGTPYYIAPEKVQKKMNSARSDIYSLGATLYHAITGQPPYEGADAVEVIKARFKGPPPPVCRTPR